MSGIRPAAVAGAFYPADPTQLKAMITAYLAEAAARPEAQGPVPKAIIAPHAGYIYSGPVAATVYARLAPARERIRRVILLGPCHRVPVRGLALPSVDFFATPLGNVPIDAEARERLADLPHVQVFDPTHREEHSLEVHLPFLQMVLGEFTLVPLVVGQASPDQVAGVLDLLWGGPETVIVISSDLSHYLDYSSAAAIDDRTRTAIERMDPAAIGDEQACGRLPIRGLLVTAKKRNLSVATVDIRNSGDTAGPRDRVVGYGAWVFVEPEAGATQPVPSRADPFAEQTRALLARHGATLLHLAAGSIEHGIATGAPLAVNTADYPAELREQGASFVTLKKNRQLRGCIGSLQAWRPLVEDVADNAFKAGFKDPRFPVLKGDEVLQLDLSISVLSPAVLIHFTDEADLLRQLRPNIDGLIIQDGPRRALFLPQVWEQLPQPVLFLNQLKRKAGLPENHWSKSFTAFRFITEGIAMGDLPNPQSVWSRGNNRN